MKLPGLAWLEMAVGRDHDGMTTYSQRAIFQPRGLAGHAYWRSISPFHGVILGRCSATSPQPPSGPAAQQTNPRQPGTEQHGKIHATCQEHGTGPGHQDVVAAVHPKVIDGYT